MAPIHKEFVISLSVRKEKSSVPQIRVETALDGVAFFSSAYPRGRVWQSAVWPEALQEVQHVSVTIGLGSRCATRDRLAMNHTFAGITNYLDAASKFDSLRIQLLDAHHFTTTELLEIIQPAAMLVHCRLDIATKLVDISTELIDAAMQAKSSHSCSDDTIGDLYSRVRMAARAAGRLHLGGLHTRVEKLNCAMAEIMAAVGFVGPGMREKVEGAIGEVDGVLAGLMDGL